MMEGDLRDYARKVLHLGVRDQHGQLRHCVDVRELARVSHQAWSAVFSLMKDFYVIHNDIKPENFLVDKDGWVYLHDLGGATSAQVINGQLVAWEARVGTEGYTGYDRWRQLTNRAPPHLQYITAEEYDIVSMALTHLQLLLGCHIKDLTPIGECISFWMQQLTKEEQQIMQAALDRPENAGLKQRYEQSVPLARQLQADVEQLQSCGSKQGPGSAVDLYRRQFRVIARGILAVQLHPHIKELVDDLHSIQEEAAELSSQDGVVQTSGLLELFRLHHPAVRAWQAAYDACDEQTAAAEVTKQPAESEGPFASQAAQELVGDVTQQAADVPTPQDGVCWVHCSAQDASADATAQHADQPLQPACAAQCLDLPMDCSENGSHNDSDTPAEVAAVLLLSPNKPCKQQVADGPDGLQVCSSSGSSGWGLIGVAYEHSASAAVQASGLLPAECWDQGINPSSSASSGGSDSGSSTEVHTSTDHHLKHSSSDMDVQGYAADMAVEGAVEASTSCTAAHSTHEHDSSSVMERSCTLTDSCNDEGDAADSCNDAGDAADSCSDVVDAADSSADAADAADSSASVGGAADNSHAVDIVEHNTDANVMEPAAAVQEPSTAGHKPGTDAVEYAASTTAIPDECNMGKRVSDLAALDAVLSGSAGPTRRIAAAARKVLASRRSTPLDEEKLSACAATVLADGQRRKLSVVELATHAGGCVVEHSACGDQSYMSEGEAQCHNSESGSQSSSLQGCSRLTSSSSSVSTYLPSSDTADKMVTAKPDGCSGPAAAALLTLTPNKAKTSLRLTMGQHVPSSVAPTSLCRRALCWLRKKVTCAKHAIVGCLSHEAEDRQPLLRSCSTVDSSSVA